MVVECLLVVSVRPFGGVVQVGLPALRLGHLYVQSVGVAGYQVFAFDVVVGPFAQRKAFRGKAFHTVHPVIRGVDAHVDAMPRSLAGVNVRAVVLKQVVKGQSPHHIA